MRKLREALETIQQTLRSLVLELCSWKSGARGVSLTEFLLGWSPGVIPCGADLPQLLRLIRCTDEVSHWDCCTWTEITVIIRLMEYLQNGKSQDIQRLTLLTWDEAYFWWSAANVLLLDALCGKMGRHLVFKAGA